MFLIGNCYNNCRIALRDRHPSNSHQYHRRESFCALYTRKQLFREHHRRVWSHSFPRGVPDRLRKSREGIPFARLRSESLRASNSPLHLAVLGKQIGAIELLLRRSAGPNEPNNNNINVGVNVQDYWGNTPLHLALDLVSLGDKKAAELLLRNGADSNVANRDGLTPLHIICQREDDDDLVESFFNINKETTQSVQVNAKDMLGRTPLQLAVAHLLPHVVDVLLNHGADLSGFVFPTESEFAECLNSGHDEDAFKLKLSSGLLAIIESLEKKGYKMGHSAALTVMKLFAEHAIFEKSTDLDECWYEDLEFARAAKKHMLGKNLSLYNLMELQPEDAENKLTYEDYFEFACANEYWFIPETYRKACIARLCEILSKDYCRRWQLQSPLGDCRFTAKIPMGLRARVYSAFAEEEEWVGEEKVKAFFPGLVHVAYVLRPVGFLQKAISEVSNKLFREDFKFRVIVLTSVCELHEFIDKDQLTDQLGGHLPYCHHTWIQNRINLEKFSSMTQDVSLALDSFTRRLAEIEFPNNALATTSLLSQQQAEYNELKEEIMSAARHGESLLDSVRQLTGKGNGRSTRQRRRRGEVQCEN
ncbi:unnamed protein product [Trichogramma brassicae]|uniref:CRAL-TRIO domain-containing protein n=1 Tax=Trichogramma brassicae TaxID=86971 RepID=A0A6H5J606_9HYME|nr:unnamed protein product [Trichogramma brassicae]